MKSPQVQKILEALTQAAQASGAVLLKHFGKRLRVSEKPGAGLVTDIDLASEEAALKILRRAAPDFSVLTEESGALGPSGTAAGRWILDPLDGTTNYVHGFPMFCVSVAAEWKGQVIAGVIYHPILRETYIAAKGRGASVNGKRMRVSKTTRLEGCLLTTGFTYRKDKWLRSEMDAFERLSRVARAVRRPGSAALDLAYTARGVFDGFWERRLSPWDIAAGALLVQESGGKVTDFQGKPFRADMSEVVAAGRSLHRDFLAEITRALELP